MAKAVQLMYSTETLKDSDNMTNPVHSTYYYRSESRDKTKGNVDNERGNGHMRNRDLRNESKNIRAVRTLRANSTQHPARASDLHPGPPKRQ